MLRGCFCALEGLDKLLYTRGLHLGLQGFWLDLRILDFGYIV